MPTTDAVMRLRNVLRRQHKALATEEAYVHWRHRYLAAIASVLNDFVPLSNLMAEQVMSLRTWSKGRARLATTPVPERKLRKLA